MHAGLRPSGRLAWNLLLAVGTVAAGAADVGVVLPLWGVGRQWWRANLDPATRGWVAAALAGTALYILVVAVTSLRHRRMVLLIIDDLDRCASDRVVRLLETVHTLLRERAAPKRLRRWREPAPFGVIVCVSGAWIRDAFAKHYETFDRNAEADAVHDLGADFLQKIFDHSVLVPGLSPEQVEDLIHVVAGSRYHAVVPRQPRQPRALPANTTAELREADHPAEDHRDKQRRPPSGEPTLVDTRTDGPDTPPTLTPVPTPTASPPTTVGVPPSSAVDHRRQTERASADSQAARSDLGVNAQLLITHLLTNYPEILPGNPRLIIRVASAWAMLRAVARSLNLEVDAEPANELLVRASVIWVRFPVLADELLDAAEPPNIDPGHEGCSPRWRRRDVQHVLTMHDGQRLDIEDLALYYGRFYTPPISTPTPAKTDPVKEDPSRSPDNQGDHPSRSSPPPETAAGTASTANSRTNPVAKPTGE